MFTFIVFTFISSRDPSATFLDATPDLIHVPASACRIAELFPDAKLVAVLRDPAQRALSNWNMVRLVVIWSGRGGEATE